MMNISESIANLNKSIANGGDEVMKVSEKRLSLMWALGTDT